MARQRIDHFRAVAMGIVPGWENIDRFGRNLDVDSLGGTPEDIWNGGGLYTGFPVGDPELISEKLVVVSTSAADSAAGTGLRGVRLYGLGEDGLAQTEDIATSGLTPAVSVNNWYRMNLAVGLTAGSGGTNAGTVTIRHQTTSANVFGLISPGQGTMLTAGYTVPADREALFVAVDIGVSNAQQSAQEITGALAVRGYGGMWINTFPTSVATVGGLHMVPVGGAPLPPLTDMIIRSISATADNLAVTAKIELFTYPQGIDP